MNTIYNVIAYILCYKILVEGKEANGVSFLNIFNKSDSIINDQRFEPLDLTKNLAGTGVTEFDNASKTDEDDDHSFRRSKLSFIQNEINKNVEPSNKDKNEKDKSVDSKKNGETFHSEKSKITNEEIIKNGEDFYINEGVTEYGYNNDEEFYNSFHVNNNNNPVKINSLCFGLADSDSCQQNSNCFYDEIYKTCFQKCSLLNERDCLKYSECKYENGACENHGFLSIKVFDNDFGEDIRSCELFESEESCYLMETRYKKSDNNNRTNFNCVWLTYKQEIKKNIKNENDNMEKIDTNATISQNIETEKQNDRNMNYILRTNNPVSIAKDEKFISLLEIKLNNKKKKGNSADKENKNDGKKNDDDDDDDGESDIDLDEIDDDYFKDDDEDDDDIESNKMNETYEDKNDINNNMDKSISSVTTPDSQNNIQMDKKNTEGNINEVSKNLDDTNKFEKNLEKNKSLNYRNNNNSNLESKLEENVNIQNNIEKENGITGSFSELAENSVKIIAEPIDNDSKISNININEDNKYDLDNDTHISIEKEVIEHDFHNSLNKENTSYPQNNNKYEDIVTIETNICINLNTKPSPSVLLEGALLAESEAELRKIKKKYNLPEEEICVKPPKETHMIYNPNKEYYIVGEKIEIKCQKGYKISSKTNNALCIGGNKIMPNIFCELENDNEYRGGNKYKLKNDPNSDINYSLSILVGIIIFVFTGLY
ncbi:apical sushi protein, putative [Plasmodium vinckei vinckei]|uniref:Apical sushi protein, putative n=1 Tax=Plasmodium vinckei vinckei TaxID=54757 RepID=A0A449BQZ5_PLAVN|nr:apical sushi protein, putative [Plasmodium vinckei vinckei]VEV55880.1 apical sushi protein, putative [Plasmodium vinckei vinckei]